MNCVVLIHPSQGIRHSIIIAVNDIDLINQELSPYCYNNLKCPLKKYIINIHIL